METKEHVPDAVVRRLPGYYRHLRELESEGVTRLSSQALGARMGLTASQIRQDINFFGGFGQQGYGYHVPNLKKRISQILGIDETHAVVIVGAGNIGLAVANYPSFRTEGFRIDALFDIDPTRLANAKLTVPVLPVSSLLVYLQQNAVDILVIATPADCAQEILDTAAEAKVRAVWNFAPVDLIVPDWMEMATVHLSDSLMGLSFRMHEREVHKQEVPAWYKE